MEEQYTLERFITLKGSKALSYAQCTIFGVKDLNKGWYNKNKNNSVTGEEWSVAVETLDTMKRTITLQKQGGIKTRQHLYLMKSANGMYKIGISQNVKKRAANIRTATGFDIKVLSVWNTGKRTARSIEMAAHLYFSEYKQIGEWFNVGVDNFIDHFDKFVGESVSGGKKLKLPYIEM